MHLLQLSNNKKIIFFLVLFFSLIFTKINSSINNSVIISVGNQPITYLDLIKEMKLISFLNNVKLDNSLNKMIIKRKKTAPEEMAQEKVRGI